MNGYQPVSSITALSQKMDWNCQAVVMKVQLDFLDRPGAKVQTGVGEISIH